MSTCFHIAGTVCPNCAPLTYAIPVFYNQEKIGIEDLKKEIEELKIRLKKLEDRQQKRKRT